jgi:catechol 2,3-dioxygenase-like lactoylglutathione lyase family enzyme
MFQEAFPILTVADLEAGLAFYRDQLEFVEIYRYPEQGDPVYVGLELGTSRLGIGLDPRVLSGEGRPDDIDRPVDLEHQAHERAASLHGYGQVVRGRLCSEPQRSHLQGAQRRWQSFVAETTTGAEGKYSVRLTEGGAGDYYAVARRQVVQDGINTTDCLRARSTTKHFNR